MTVMVRKWGIRGFKRGSNSNSESKQDGPELGFFVIRTKYPELELDLVLHRLRHSLQTNTRNRTSPDGGKILKGTH